MLNTQRTCTFPVCGRDYSGAEMQKIYDSDKLVGLRAEVPGRQGGNRGGNHRQFIYGDRR